ncbi:putative candidate secreted effector protein [Blumeria hordei DH14]|uniref:Putative candidate secreted effector protein n=1 Tax=Blumeria graminis f. sp. hordei (strain DH14) TaxID=546991 RepID=N1JH05_BLUG1|nr:putative candidate secreted effector protein [Blumeria hordei DH14]
MKIFSPASTAALACLLLVVPVALAVGYFQCSHDERFSLAYIQHKDSQCEARHAKDDEPRGPNGEVYRTTHIMTVPRVGFFVYYIIQVIDDSPTYRLYEDLSNEWEPCVYQETNKHTDSDSDESDI